MRVQCGFGHYFDDALGACDHDDGGEPCGWRPSEDEDPIERLRRARALQDELGRQTDHPDGDVERVPHAADEAREALRQARARLAQGGAP